MGGGHGGGGRAVGRALATSEGDRAVGRPLAASGGCDRDVARARVRNSPLGGRVGGTEVTAPASVHQNPLLLGFWGKGGS